MKRLYEILYKRAPRLLKAINKKKFNELDRAQKRADVFRFLANIMLHSVIEKHLNDPAYSDDEKDALRHAAEYAERNVMEGRDILEKI